MPAPQPNMRQLRAAFVDTWGTSAANIDNEELGRLMANLKSRGVMVVSTAEEMIDNG